MFSKKHVFINPFFFFFFKESYLGKNNPLLWLESWKLLGNWISVKKVYLNIAKFVFHEPIFLNSTLRMMPKYVESIAYYLWIRLHTWTTSHWKRYIRKSIISSQNPPQARASFDFPAHFHFNFISIELNRKPCSLRKYFPFRGKENARAHSSNTGEVICQVVPRIPTRSGTVFSELVLIAPKFAFPNYAVNKWANFS